MRKYNVALAERDVAAQLAFFAEGWQGKSGLSRSDFGKHLQKTIDEGTYNAQQWALDEAIVVVDKNTATIDQADLRSPTGGGRFIITLKKEADGAWRCLNFSLSKQANAAAESARELRERIASDPLRPGYHFVNPEGVGMPFDPNGAIYWKGRYHLFLYLPGQPLRLPGGPLGARFENRSFSLASPPHVSA